MLFKSIIYSSMIIALSAAPLMADSWRMFFYMDSSDQLSDMAWKNITDIMRGNPNKLVEVIIQLHAYNNVALRYVVDKSTLKFVEEVELSGDGKQDFINATSWAFAKNSADHTMLVFSNHGWGALDPQWNPVTEAWEAAEMSMPHDGGSAVCSISETSKKRSSLPEQLHKKHRACMFNSTTNTYLSNDDLVAGLAYVHAHVMNKKKFDMVVFDTCMGCMVEIASYVAPYADYLVGVQSCALVDGFDYQGIVAALNKGNSARDTAIECVSVFDAYYAQHDEAGMYTCAALDLAMINQVTTALNSVVKKLLKQQRYIPLIKQARGESPRFCLWPIYSDVVAFLKLVEHNLIENYAIQDNDGLLGTMRDFYRVAKKMVVARCGGHTTEGKAYGMSIYLPNALIDQSYQNSLFAKKSQWINLLKVICG